jgi:Mrp family chromosome partitioning ATPase
VLGGKSQLSRALVKDSRTNALLLSPARARNDANRVLGSNEMAQLVGYLRGTCDLLIINAPPVLGDGSASIVARYADAVMLVTRAGTGRRPATSYAIDSLARISSPPIGVVLAS